MQSRAAIVEEKKILYTIHNDYDIILKGGGDNGNKKKKDRKEKNHKEEIVKEENVSFLHEQKILHSMGEQDFLFLRIL